MSATASVESLYETIRNLPVSDRLRLIERLAHQAAEEMTGRASTDPATSEERGRGFDVGRAQILEDFDAPLPDDVLAAFQGDGRVRSE